METIILVTVLTTLGVVAIVSAIVVMFFKLRKKVDVSDFDREIENIYNEVRKEIDRVNTTIDNEFNESYETLRAEDENIIRLIDKRCDKLDTKIKNLDITSNKELLTN